eukprot:scaffold113569_cov47-Prasinocladus_malaysianus.AAC.1
MVHLSCAGKSNSPSCSAVRLVIDPSRLWSADAHTPSAPGLASGQRQLHRVALRAVREVQEHSVNLVVLVHK